MDEISLGDISKIGIVFMFQCYVHRLAAEILRCPACPSLLFNRLQSCSGWHRRNFCNLHLQPALGSAPEPSNAVGNPPEPAPATCTGAFRNFLQLPGTSATIRNRGEPSGTLHQNLPEPAPGTSTGTFRNLLELSTTSTTIRNPQEPSGTLPQNSAAPLEPSGTLHQNPLEPYRTFRNLRLQPAPEHTGAYLG